MSIYREPPRMPRRYAGMTPRHAVVASSHGGARDMLARLLRAAGYSVVHADDSEEVFEQMGRSLVRRRTIGALDLLVVDARGAGGDALLEQIAEVPVESRPAFMVAITAHDAPVALGKALGLGAAVFVAPFDPARLLDDILDIAPPFEIGLTRRAPAIEELLPLR
jgi:CheY-like chemotaxis protein